MDSLTLSPEYYVKVLKLDNTVVADPLLHSGVEFTNSIYVIGQRSELGSFTIALRDVKDALNRFLLSDYNSLDYEQRVEIYESPDGLGIPIFTGVIAQLQGDLNSPAISGTGITRRLETRRLRRYHQINTDAQSALAGLLNNYKFVNTDLFANISNWTVIAGTWSTSGNVLSADLGSSADIVWKNAWTAEQWRNAKISFDLLMPTNSTLSIYFDEESHAGYSTLEQVQFSFTGVYAPADMNLISLFIRRLGGSTNVREGAIAYIAGQWNHIDVYSIVETGGRRTIVEINKAPIINYLDPFLPQHGGTFEMFASSPAFAGTMSFANFVFYSSQSLLKPGSIPATTSQINQVFNGESNLSAIEWVCQNQGWQYKIIPQAGEGNDLLEANTTIGRDLSGQTMLEENVNISDLTFSRTSEELATSLLMYGQSQDDYTAGFVYNAISQWATYGIVEKEYQDPRIVDSATARIMAKQRSDIYSLGKVSIGATILDPTIIHQNVAAAAATGKAVWGNADYGTPMPLRAGDYAWLRVPSRNIDRKVQIVSLTRREGTFAVDVVLDYFPWAGTQQAKSYQEQYLQSVRSWMSRMNGQSIVLTAGGASTLTWNVWLRGYSIWVKIDALVASGSGSVSVTINGTDRTTALGGPWTGDIHFKDTTWLVTPGSHTIAFTFAATKTLHIALQSNVLS